MNLVRLLDGKLFSAIKYTGVNRQEVLKWAGGQIIETETLDLIIENYDYDFIAKVDQWLVRFDNIIVAYNWSDIEYCFFAESERINNVKGMVDDTDFLIIKDIYNQYYWRQKKYVHDRFVAELLFQHYVGQISNMGFTPQVVEKLTNIFKSVYTLG